MTEHQLSLPATTYATSQLLRTVGEAFWPTRLGTVEWTLGGPLAQYLNSNDKNRQYSQTSPFYDFTYQMVQFVAGVGKIRLEITEGLISSGSWLLLIDNKAPPTIVIRGEIVRALYSFGFWANVNHCR